MLAGGEIDARALEFRAFGFQAQALLESGFAWQFDVASGSKNAMPGYAVFGAVAQRPDHLTRAARKSGGFGHLTVSGDFAARDLANDAADLVEHAGYRSSCWLVL